MMKKIDFILETADFSHDQDGWLCGSCAIVGTFAGRGFTSDTKEGSAQQMVEYFDKEIDFEGNSVVKGELIKIGWNSEGEDVSISESYLKDNLISKIIHEEFSGFNFVSNQEAIQYAFETEINTYSDEWLSKKCKDVFNIDISSAQEALDVISTEQMNTENWGNFGKDVDDLKSYFREYYSKKYDHEELKGIFDSMYKI